MISFKTFLQLSALLATGLAPVTSAQTTIHPPGGSATITVQLDGQLSPSGCLDVNGLWTKSGACATYGGNGQGVIDGPNGSCELDKVSNLHCIGAPGGTGTAWVGDYLNGNKSAMYLVANSGAATGPRGGPIFYTFAQPSGTSSAVLTGNGTVGASVKVYLSWIVKS
ncbi:hypothetical protein MMC10_001069 [Thelotrema lepadinum]|nr:hypothetical protein [Thelotrema lepadinum]